MIQSPTAVLTTGELAELFQVTAKTVRAWIRSGMPTVVAGTRGAGNESQIDLRTAVEWYFAENRERLELDRQRARLAEEMADKHALENAVRRGELGVVSQMAEFYGSHIDRAQRRLAQIPQTLGQYCDERNAAIVVGVAARLIDECIRELAADGAEIQQATDAALAPAPGVDSEPVGRRPKDAKRRK